MGGVGARPARLVAMSEPIVLRALAKLTLSLRITGVRTDGYHLLDAEMVTVDLCDTVTIASGGCNVMSYLASSPNRITAVDLNHTHVALTKLKLAGLQGLPNWAEFYRFFGEADEHQNIDKYYEHLRALMEDLTRGLGTRVRITRRPRGGTIEIEFYSDAELDRLADQLRTAAATRSALL